MGLIDMNASMGRVDGGIGLALEDPKLVVEVEEAGDISAEGPLAERAQDAAERVFSATGIEGGVRIEVREDYPQHVGLGSGTQVALAVGKAISEIYGIDLRVRDIARLVGRGGTSGIGTAAFEHGGFILDGGHSTREKPSFLPSSASRASPAPVLARYDFPPWKVVLVLPEEGTEVAGRREVNIFQEYCPVPLEEVREISHIILMKMLPAVVEKDLDSFGEGVNQLQTLGFKKVEVDLQSQTVKDILRTCQEHSAGAGLSSFGPVVYSLVEEEGELLEALEGMDGISEIIVTRANNRGAVIG